MRENEGKTSEIYKNSAECIIETKLANIIGMNEPYCSKPAVGEEEERRHAETLLPNDKLQNS